MKAIMISIKPEWVAKILNGEKTIEIRKTMPKCDLPIDVYIYCTKRHRGYTNTIARLKNNKFINFDKPDEIMPVLYDIEQTGFDGKVVAKFTLNKVEKISIKYGKGWVCGNLRINEIEKETQLSRFELYDYLKNNRSRGYAWHIDNLEIFDKPKELSEFNIYCDKHELCKCDNCKRLKQAFIEFGFAGEYCDSRLTKAPQNFCYVEVE